MALAYANTYGIPLFITHTMNCFGERQHPEKFIPKVMRKILKGEVVKIHGSVDRTQSGSRSYIHCRNVANGVHYLLQRFTQREKYNIVGEKEVLNLELAEFIAQILKKELKYEIVDYHSSRPGHDLRYALSGLKMLELGWQTPMRFEQSLRSTVKWTMANPHWLWWEKEEEHARQRQAG
jgi:dTDP-glucose 4,6-dehydratase